jgi:hypothetical protein
VDYLTRIIGYMKRISNFSMPRQHEAARRYYAPAGNVLKESVKEPEIHA